MIKAQKIYSWLHLWLGLVVGIIFTIASITGVLLIFEDELEEVFYPQLYNCEVPTGRAARLPLDSLFAKAQSYAGNHKMLRLSIKDQQANRAYLFTSDEGRMKRLFLSLNPYTGKKEYALSGGRHFFSVVEELHRRLLIGNVGKTITGIACLSYLVILITGLILWWPKNKKILKQRLKIKWDAKAKRLNWDVHAVGGFYTLPIILLICLTGLTWSYKWFNNGIFLLFDGKLQHKNANHLEVAGTKNNAQYPIQKAYFESFSKLPYEGRITILLPSEKEKTIEINREREDAAIPNVVDRLFFAVNTGAFIKADPYDAQTRGMKVRRFMLPLHSGSFGGMLTKCIYCLTVLLAASMPFTGLFIWLGRKKKKAKEKKAVIDSSQAVTYR